METDGLSVSVASVEFHGLDVNGSFSVACLLRNNDKKSTPPQMYKGFLSAAPDHATSTAAWSTGAGVDFINMPFTKASEGHSAHIHARQDRTDGRLWYCLSDHLQILW